MFEISQDEKENLSAKIRVVGIGGGGCNAVNTMIKAGLSGVEYIVANTDAQALAANLAPTKIQLGVDITKGLGAGANPEVGRKAALEEYEKLSEVLEGSDMVFITAGMGGGTGTGAAPIIAKLCKELGALTVGVVTKPFLFEGKRRFKQAEAGIQVLEESVDSLITIPNQRLLHIAGESLSLIDTFKKADEVLLHAVQGIADLITNTGLINSDFADVNTIMHNKGLALMGTGIANGSDRAIKAATEAISSPLLEDVTIDGATGIIINITGDSSLTAFETNEAVTLIMEAADEDAEIIFGTVIDEEMADNVKVTVIATGLNGTGLRPSASSSMMDLSRQRVDNSHQKAIAEEPKIERSVEMVVEERANSIETRNTMPVENEHPIERPEIRAEEPVQEASHEQESRSHGLASSIKEAATRYQNDKSDWSTDSGSSLNSKPDYNESPSRAKSIAERLGFLNFDEDELDKPTFLRKGDSDNSHPTAE